MSLKKKIEVESPGDTLMSVQERIELKQLRTDVTQMGYEFDLAAEGNELGVWNPNTNTPFLTADASQVVNKGYYELSEGGPAPFAGHNFAMGDVFDKTDKIAKIGSRWFRRTLRGDYATKSDLAVVNERTSSVENEDTFDVVDKNHNVGMVLDGTTLKVKEVEAKAFRGSLNGATLEESNEENALEVTDPSLNYSWYVSKTAKPLTPENYPSRPELTQLADRTNTAETNISSLLGRTTSVEATAGNASLLANLLNTRTSSLESEEDFDIVDNGLNIGLLLDKLGILHVKEVEAKAFRGTGFVIEECEENLLEITDYSLNYSYYIDKNGIPSSGAAVGTKHVLDDAKMSFLGDSMTTTDYGSLTPETTFYGILQSRHNMTIKVNGVSGTAIGGADVNRISSDARIDSLGADFTPDIIWVMGSTNDFGSLGRNVTLGTYADPDTATTFYGGMKALCKKLTAKYKTSRIFFTPNPPRADRGFGELIQRFAPDWPTDRTRMVDFVDAAEIVCRDYGVIFINGFAKSGFTYQNMNQSGLYSDDKLHLNAVGSEKLADWVANQIQSNY